MVKERIFDVNQFLQQLRAIRERFHITKVGRSNERNRRRISILVVDEFLKAGGDIDQAFFLEANLYHNLKAYHLSCDPTLEEIRLRQLRRERRIKLGGFNPLKLVSENIEPEDYEPYPLTEAIIKILTEGKEEKNGFSGDHKRRRPAQSFRYLQKDAQLFKKQKGPSFYRTH